MAQVSKRSDQDEQEWIDAYVRRNLEASLPELRVYLRPGAKVLDVGCGPGSITLDVAEAVKPGEVIGIDKHEESVIRARELAAEKAVPNVTFAAMDAHKLDFDDSTFDVVYSNTVIHSVLDPVGAILEYKRVTKKGGGVIASGVRDWSTAARHPASPALQQVWDGWLRGYQAMSDRYASGDEVSGPYLDLHAGRKCVGWFVSAGLRDINVQIQISRGEAYPIKYCGGERFEPEAVDLLPIGIELSNYYDYLYGEGFLDEETVRDAQVELEQWYSNPRAFHYLPAMFVAGRV